MKVVLVVDDDEMYLRATARGADRPVFTASSAAAAELIVEEARPDLAIVDVRLGSDDGISLIERLSKHPDLHIVVCSAFLTPELTMAAANAGARDARSKPVRLVEIIRQVEAPELGIVPVGMPSLERVRRQYIELVLAACDGNLSRAAGILKIDRKTLQRLRDAPMPPQ